MSRWGAGAKVTTRVLSRDSIANRPVSKVSHPVIAQLEKWIEKDEEAYEQMRYWCETNDEDTETSKDCDASRIQSHHPFEGYGCTLRRKS